MNDDLRKPMGEHDLKVQIADEKKKLVEMRKLLPKLKAEHEARLKEHERSWEIVRRLGQEIDNNEFAQKAGEEAVIMGRLAQLEGTLLSLESKKTAGIVK